MTTRAVNKRFESYDVYIGRGSRWGNDFSHREGTKASHVVASRDEAIACYREWLWAEIAAGRVTLEELAALHGKRLGCFCKPKACHGDVLAAAADWAAKELGQC